MNFLGQIESRDLYDEAFRDRFGKSFDASYKQAKGSAEEDYSKYADAAKKALDKAGSLAGALSKKTGIPLPLVTAVLAAGITGSPSAMPFAALLYFVKQPLMKGANRAFDATWDTAAGAIDRIRGARQPALQPEEFIPAGSFRAFVEADTWGDWMGDKLGGVAGRMAGNVAGFGGKIASAIGGRAKEIAQWAGNNPKEVARLLFLVGAGAVIGAGVGRLTHHVKDFIVQKIRDHGIPKEELAWLRHNLVLDKQHDGSYGTGQDHVVLQTGDRDTYQAATERGETAGSYVSSATTVSDDAISVDAATTRNDAGGYGYVSSNVRPGEFTGRAASGVPHQDLGDAYRDTAVALKGMGKQLKGLNPDPQETLAKYGHSAAAEIRRRLASPDTYTRPAAIAGAVVGGTGNKRDK